MDSEQICKLIDAGYTKAEIDAMQNGNGASGETNESAGKDDKDASEIPSNESTTNAVEVKSTDDAIKALTDTVNALTETVKAMQNANIEKAATDKADNKSVEDVMKSFIDTF